MPVLLLLLLLSVVAPLVTMLEDPTTSPEKAVPVLAALASEADEAEVVVVDPAVVVLVPAATTEPSLMDSRVTRSMLVVFSPMELRIQNTSSSIKLSTSAVVLAFVKVKLKPMLMLFWHFQLV